MKCMLVLVLEQRKEIFSELGTGSVSEQCTIFEINKISISIQNWFLSESQQKSILEKNIFINGSFTLHFIVLDNYLIASSARSHEGRHVHAKECSAAKRKSQHSEFDTVNWTTSFIIRPP